MSKRVLPKIHDDKEEKVNYRLPPKLPYILNVNGEVIGMIERENLPYVAPRLKPPPKPPPKVPKVCDTDRVNLTWNPIIYNI